MLLRAYYVMVYIYVLSYPPKRSLFRASNMPSIKGGLSQHFTYTVSTKTGNVLHNCHTLDYITGIYVQEQLTFQRLVAIIRKVMSKQKNSNLAIKYKNVWVPCDG